MATFPEHITTERLRLRLWQVTDVAAFGQAINENIEHLRPWMPWIAAEPKPDAVRAEQVLSWRDLWEAGTEAHYGVFAGQALIGSGGLQPRVGDGGLDIGYWIHIDHLRRGYATEVARALTSTAFAIPGIDRVEIHHDVANVASGGVPRALGYRRGPDLQTRSQAPAETGTNWTWIITDTEWAELQVD